VNRALLLGLVALVGALVLLALGGRGEFVRVDAEPGAPDAGRGVEAVDLVADGTLASNESVDGELVGDVRASESADRRAAVEAAPRVRLVAQEDGATLANGVVVAIAADGVRSELDADGGVVELPSGDAFLVEARAPERSSRWVLVPSEDEHPGVVSIPLFRAATLVAEVVDGNGEPADGCTILVEPPAKWNLRRASAALLSEAGVHLNPPSVVSHPQRWWGALELVGAFDASVSPVERADTLVRLGLVREVDGAPVFATHPPDDLGSALRAFVDDADAPPLSPAFVDVVVPLDWVRGGRFGPPARFEDLPASDGYRWIVLGRAAAAIEPGRDEDLGPPVDRPGSRRVFMNGVDAHARSTPFALEAGAVRTVRASIEGSGRIVGSVDTRGDGSLLGVTVHALERRDESAAAGSAAEDALEPPPPTHVETGARVEPGRSLAPFELRSLTPGSYLVTVSAWSEDEAIGVHRTQRLVVDVEAGRTTDLGIVEVIGPHSISLRFEFTDADGRVLELDEVWGGEGPPRELDWMVHHRSDAHEAIAVAELDLARSATASCSGLFPGEYSVSIDRALVRRHVRAGFELHDLTSRAVLELPSENEHVVRGRLVRPGAARVRYPLQQAAGKAPYAHAVFVTHADARVHSMGRYGERSESVGQGLVRAAVGTATCVAHLVPRDQSSVGDTGWIARGEVELLPIPTGVESDAFVASLTPVDLGLEPAAGVVVHRAVDPRMGTAAPWPSPLYLELVELDGREVVSDAAARRMVFAPADADSCFVGGLVPGATYRLTEGAVREVPPVEFVAGAPGGWTDVELGP